MSKSALLNGKGNKAQDESHMKTLRDLSQIPNNRHCFDCGQRGPTYVNITVGSFVCMTCSGLLRGLTPPHRVKSISMASFTPEEIELLKSRGNEYCRKVWLATHTARDSHLGSEQDPDRRNALKSHMSAKYEQKRYYVDPSKLPKSELTEIQAQTVRALSSSASSISNSSGGSVMQKSPSLSSASSGSSLSLQQNQTNPSPVMNNLRNNHQQPNRLVNSATLPDIKPLATLLGSVNIHSNNGTSTATATSNSSHPINFINNLSNNDEKIINTNHQQQNTKDPWGGDSFGVGNANTNGISINESGNSSGFNANFANFDEAFCTNSNGNGGNAFGGTDFFNTQVTGGSKNGPSNGFADFESIQKPLVPFNGTNSNGSHFNQRSANNNGNVNNGKGHPDCGGEDRYAALKDLDEMFKYGDSPAGNNVANGLPNSVSVPANLSASSAGVSDSGTTGWFSSSPNQQNPFSQVASSSPHGTTTANGWSINGSSTSSGANPHNPFFSSQSWQSSNNNTNGNVNSTTANSTMFPPSHNQHMNFQHHQLTPMSAPITPSGFPPTGTSPNSLFSQNTSPFINAPQTKPVFNPFFSSASTSAVNPHNPFL